MGTAWKKCHTILFAFTSLSESRLRRVAIRGKLIMADSRFRKKRCTKGVAQCYNNYATSCNRIGMHGDNSWPWPIDMFVSKNDEQEDQD